MSFLTLVSGADARNGIPFNRSTFPLAPKDVYRDHGFMATPYRPFLAGGDQLSMGIKTLDTAEWLQMDDQFDHQMAERRRLLQHQPEDVVAALPASEPSQDELLAVLLDHLAVHAADHYRIAKGEVEDRRTGHVYGLTSEAHAPLMLIGRLVQEDFCLLRREADAYHLVAAVLCFPAHWRLRDKLGLPLIDIHAPVPGFAEKLGNPVSRLFERLDTARPVQRLNWSLVDRTDLYLPPSHRTVEVEITPDNAGTRLWLRVERQTLRRLPQTRDVVFGIRTHLSRLEDAIDDEPAAEALIARLEAMPPAMARYKNLEKVKTPLLTYLRNRFCLPHQRHISGTKSPN